MKTQRSEIIEEVIHSYRQISQVLLKDMRAAIVDATDIHPGLLLVLRVLAEKRQLSQHEIAKELCHSDAAVSRQISVLQKKGYITAEPDPENRRVIIVMMTQEGAALYQQVRTIVDTRCAEVLADVSDEVLREIVQTNARLYEKISIHQKR